MKPRNHPQPFSTADGRGELVRHSFYSQTLDNERGVVVYLPPGYGEDAGRRYPVLYAQDGQNLFDGRTSFIPGQHWYLSETADALIREGAIEPLIIVGVYNAGGERIDEYTPTTDPGTGAGGRADEYGRMLADELKPFIDGEYLTLTGREHTGIGGSSLGGLVSLHLGFKRPETFGRVIAMSPSLWWNDCHFLKYVDALENVPPIKVWLDAGTREGNTDCNAEALRDKLVARSFMPDVDVAFMRADGATHSEQDWAHRVHHALRFTFPAQGLDAEPWKLCDGEPHPSQYAVAAGDEGRHAGA